MVSSSKGAGDDHIARTRPVAIVMCGVRLFTADWETYSHEM
ncbi:unnamed protein product [[Actinomadura] parvosata subsp. kistnae]|nr:unnamed protein product [Actinomadura parvosata subsp. kistnae]